MWQNDFYDIDVLGVIFHAGGNAIYAEVQPIDITFSVLVGKIEIRSAIGQQLFAKGRSIIFIGIGPAMYPDIGEGVGGMVDVLHFNKSVQRVFYVVEGDIDGIIDLLLPVVVCGEWRAVGW